MRVSFCKKEIDGGTTLALTTYFIMCKAKKIYYVLVNWVICTTEISLSPIFLLISNLILHQLLATCLSQTDANETY